MSSDLLRLFGGLLGLIYDIAKATLKLLPGALHIIVMRPRKNDDIYMRGKSGLIDIRSVNGTRHYEIGGDYDDSKG